MTETDDESAIQRIRRVAELNLTAQLDSRNRLIDEASAASRWILATLVTINSGAAFATLTIDSISSFGRICAAGFFCIGIFFAVMLGYATILAAGKLLPRVVDLADFWMGCLLDAAFDADALDKKQKSAKNAAIPWKIASHVFGWLSLVSFFVGTAIIARQLK